MFFCPLNILDFKALLYPLGVVWRYCSMSLHYTSFTVCVWTRYVVLCYVIQGYNSGEGRKLSQQEDKPKGTV